jgi:hypothetical protein
MWLCFKNAFLSVVQDDKSERLLVRARLRDHLTTAFGETIEIAETPANDYRWRTWVSRAQLGEVLLRQVDALDYTNFKANVKDPDLHSLYLEFWFLHKQYQMRRHKKNSKATHTGDT